MRAFLRLGVAALAVVLLSDRAAALDVAVQGGPVVIGNGFPDGIGATLGRLFARLTLPGSGGKTRLSVELVLTTSVVTVEPAECSAPSRDPCAETGEGKAEVSGFPASIHDTLVGVKLASALYIVPAPGAVGLSGPGGLPEGLRASSLEVALEGALYAGPASSPGTVADLRLFLASPERIRRWADGGSAGGPDRAFESGTGSGFVIGDDAHFLFPGWFTGRVVSNDGNALLVEFRGADILPVRIGAETRVWLEPDLERAAEAGLPDGVFCQIEVNYSGFATASSIFPRSTSNDAEVRVTAPSPGPRFLRGDCNGDGRVSNMITEVLVLLGYAFGGGGEPPCRAACDADGDGRLFGQVVDAIYLLRFQFLGGPPPPAPFPLCGSVPGGDPLDCEVPPSCP
ncbi:MAG TPA: hypothetical protein VMT52_20590 [Planctomycetota bacterium]|nr:hypothetical protein [Planctomycetota bacterium]